MNSIISNACQSMTKQGFQGFYNSLVAQFTPNMPVDYHGFKYRTGRATLPLTSENDALFYSVAYAMGHYLTFCHVLTDNLEIDSSDTVINLIDYGCGQGIATLAMLDHIASWQNPATTHLNIHLIEPSMIALENAYHKITHLAQGQGFSHAITWQNCQLGQAIIPDFANDAETLHLMSYILDVPAVQQQLGNITAQIHQLTGSHSLIASGINTDNSKRGFNQLAVAVTGKSQPITAYRFSYQGYDVCKFRYQHRSANAIGFMVSFPNTLLQQRVA